MRKSTPVRDHDEFMLRLPDGLRDRIAAAARSHNRSINSEIVAILETVFERSSPSAEYQEILLQLQDVDDLYSMSLSEIADLHGIQEIADIKRYLTNKIITVAEDLTKIETAIDNVVARTEKLGKTVGALRTALHRA